MKPINTNNEGSTARFFNFLPVIPILLFFILAIILYFSGFNNSSVFDPPGLLSFLNFIFLFICPMFVGYLAAKGYMVSGSVSLLTLGCGVFSMAIGSLIAGFLLQATGPNAVITIHNISVCIAGIFHFAGVSLAFTSSPTELYPHKRKFKIVLLYAIIFAILVILTLGVLQNILPTFFIQGQGPTLLRQGILGIAFFSFFISGLLFIKLYRNFQSRFLYWYATALLLISIGLGSIFLQKSFGGPIGWLGRIAQYTGGLYLLIAVFRGAKEHKVLIMRFDRILESFFRNCFETLLKERTTQLAHANEQLKQEIDDHKRTVKALKDSDLTTRALLNATTESIFLIERDSTFIALNEVTAKKLGKQPEDLIGQCGYDFIPPELVESRKNRIEELIRKNKPVRFVDERSGIFFDNSLYPLHDFKGEINRIAVFARDITKQTQAETAHRKNEKKYRNVVENASEAITVTKGKMFKFVNPKMIEFTGYSEIELMSRPFMDLVHPDDRQLVKLNYLERQKTKNSVQYELRIITKDGVIKWFESKAVIIEWEDESATLNMLTDITHRKQAEEKLNVTLHQLNAVVSHVPVIISAVDLEGKYFLSEGKGLKKLGRKSEEMIGISVYDLYKDRPDILEYIQRTLKGESIQVEVEIADEIFDLSYEPITDHTNTVSGLVVVANIITKRKQVENELKFSAEKFERWKASSPIGIIQSNAKGGIKDINDTALTMLGYSKQDLLEGSLDWAKLTPAEFLHLDKKAMEEATDKGFWTPFEKEYFHKDGHRVPIIIGGAAFKDYDDEYIVFVLEITERKKAEEALRISEEKYRSMMEAMEDPVTISSHDYKIVYMNPAMIKRTGRDATGEPCFKALHDLGTKCPWCQHHKIQNGEHFTEELVSPKDKRAYHISHSPIFHKDESISTLTVYRDTTDFKKMQSQLMQSHKMEAIGTLAGGIAHDFNNILFPVLGHTEMLLEDIPEDSPFRPRLDQIFTSALRASELVKQILTFSRHNTDELSLMKIQPVIKEALKLIRSTIPATIEIKQYIRNDCGIIKADSTQIHQIIMNLAANAHHAMEDTGGELKINFKEIQLGNDDVITFDMMPGAYACLTIADTGTGMDKDRIKKIFDPFFTTKGKNKGTGMGLSVVLGIVTNMGGTIQVYSEPGEGTEFKIYFPIEKSSFEEQNIQIQTEKSVRGGTERILLVDDEEAIIEMEKPMLERLGYQVSLRTSSIEALETFRATPDRFDLVITDMAMPNMSGDKLSVELIKIRSDIPILLCTGFSEAMSEGKATSLGIKGFLLKPIVMKNFVQKIREMLDSNKTENTN